MSWLASVDLRTKDGTWVTISAVHEAKLSAWKWLEKMQWKAYRRGISTKSPKVVRCMPTKYGTTQFEFLQGNDACAREWQDGPQE